MGLIILAVLLLAASGFGFFIMRRTKSELYAMIGTETLSIPELERFRGVSDELGAQGGFRKITEVVGAAAPRAEGPLTAELSKAPCVWYRYEVQREYEHVEYRNGHRHRDKRTETVAEYTSVESYGLMDQQGNRIAIDPTGGNPEGIEQSVDRFEARERASGGGFLGFGGFSLGGLFSDRDDTIGFRYREWLIRPGRYLYVLGEAHDRYGALAVGKPEQEGHFIIAAQTEDQLRAARTRRHQWLAAGVITAFLAGVAALVFGVIKVL